MTRSVTDVRRAAHDALATHVTDAKIEDAVWLMDRGVDVTEAARRVGYTVGALERAIERATEKEHL